MKPEISFLSLVFDVTQCPTKRKEIIYFGTCVHIKENIHIQKEEFCSDGSAKGKALQSSSLDASLKTNKIKMKGKTGATSATRFLCYNVW